MEDHKCVKQGIVQFDLGSYSNPVCTAKKEEVESDVWARKEAEGEHNLLFRYYYCPRVGATANTDVNLQIASISAGACVTSKMA